MHDGNDIGATPPTVTIGIVFNFMIVDALDINLTTCFVNNALLAQ